MEVNIFKDLVAACDVFSRNVISRKQFKQAYQALYEIISRTDKFFKVEVAKRNIIRSINRFKPAYAMINGIEVS